MSSFSPTPPKVTITLTFICLLNSLQICDVWRASSLVGTNTRAENTHISNFISCISNITGYCSLRYTYILYSNLSIAEAMYTALSLFYGGWNYTLTSEHSRDKKLFRILNLAYMCYELQYLSYYYNYTTEPFVGLKYTTKTGERSHAHQPKPSFQYHLIQFHILDVIAFFEKSWS